MDTSCWEDRVKPLYQYLLVDGREGCVYVVVQDPCVGCIVHDDTIYSHEFITSIVLVSSPIRCLELQRPLILFYVMRDVCV